MIYLLWSSPIDHCYWPSIDLNSGKRLLGLSIPHSQGVYIYPFLKGCFWGEKSVPSMKAALCPHNFLKLVCKLIALFDTYLYRIVNCKKNSWVTRFENILANILSSMFGFGLTWLASDPLWITKTHIQTDCIIWYLTI